MIPDAKLMAMRACEAMQQAYAPYSNFRVGACVLAENGELFLGCNIENASYGLTNCAERTAIFKMVAQGQQKILALAVVGSGGELCPPCGACRQVIREFAALDIPIYLCDSQAQQVIKTVTLGELLPYSFGPEFLT